MTREEAKEVLTSKMVHNSDMMLEALDMTIEALSEPTIPLSVIEKIKAEIDKHKLPCCFKDDRGYTHFLPNVIKVDDVLEIIDRKVKEVTHE